MESGIGQLVVTHTSGMSPSNHNFELDNLICRFRWTMQGLTTDANNKPVVVPVHIELTINGPDLIDDRLKVTSGKSFVQYMVC